MPWGPLATAVALGVLPAVIRTLGYADRSVGASALLLVGGIGIVVALFVEGRPVVRASFAAGIALVLGIVCTPHLGRAAVPLVLASIAVIAAAQRRTDGPVDGLRVLPIVPLALLAISWIRIGSLTLAAALLAVAMVLVVARTPLSAIEERAARKMASATERLEHGIRIGLMALFIVPLVLAPVALLTAARRVWGWFQPPPETAWQVRQVRSADEVTDAWGPWASAPTHLRRRRNAVGAAVVLLSAATFVAALPPTASTPSVAGEIGSTPAPTLPPEEEIFESPFPPLADFPAFEGIEWANAIDLEHNELGSTALPYSPTTGYTIGDYRGEFTEVEDGVRLGYEPDCDECPSAEVWWLGGSVAFGWVNRDAYTPSSALARAAEEAGVNLDVENLAVPGWTLWQEFQRLEAMLKSTDDPPEAVIFYDGFNDIASGVVDAALDGRIEPDAPSLLDPERFGRYYAEAPTLAAVGGPEAVAAATASKYRRVQALVDELVPDSIPVFFVLQPNPFDSPTQLEAIAAITGPDIDVAAQSDFGRSVRAFAQDLGGDGSVEIVQAPFDATSAPIFSDPAHMNEAGARMVAEEIWDLLGEELSAVAS